MIKLPVVVEKIIHRLENAGYEAYAVGGCVRDSLLGRVPDDWDITTSAAPEEVKRLFRKTIDTGIQHGTVTVLMGGRDSILRGEKGYEVTTYRVDGEYLDGRHPSSVSFTPSLHEDLARRDFTINAMAYNSRMGLVDDFGGLSDIERREIRAVGRAEERFREDALRMLRALRFSAQLSFSIEEETYSAICVLSEKLGKVSKERIQLELGKLLLSDNPDYYKRIFDTKLAPYISEHFSRLYTGGLPYMTAAAPKKKYLRYGMLLRNVPEYAGKILRELKLDNETIRKGKAIAGLHHREIPKNEYELRSLLSVYGRELVGDFLEMELSLSDRNGRLTREGCKPDELFRKLALAKNMLRIITERGDCLSVSELAVNGKDLKELGIESGPELGELLKRLLEHVLREPADNSREHLLALIPRLS